MQGRLVSLPRAGGLHPLPPRRRCQVRFVVTAAGKRAAPSDVPDYFQPPAPPQAPSTAPDAAPTAPAPGAQQYYMAVPQYPVTAPPPAPEPSFWSQVPPLVWIGIGVLLGNVLNSAMNFVKGGPQKMQEMAMQQMMNQMMKQAMSGTPGGASPFGGPNPFATAGGGPGVAAQNPFASAAGFPGGFPTPPAASQPPIETTATPASAGASPKTGSASSPKATTSAATAAPGGTSSGGGTRTKRKSVFVDVDAQPAGMSAAGGGGDAASATPGQTTAPPSFGDAFSAAAATGVGAGPSGTSDTNGGAASATGGDPGVGGMLDMLKNPEMQKMLYPYLPEPMRNPETFEWMLNSPEYRQQLEGMLSQQMGGGAAPEAVQELMQDADMSPEKMKAQFDALGMTPEQFVSKVMSDPDLAASMTKPSVMAAIAECTKNPMSIFKYQNDEEVMRVFEKMSTMFPQAAGMGPGGMPQGFPGPPPNAG